MKTEVCLVLCQVMMPQEKWRLPPSFPTSTKIISFFPPRFSGQNSWLSPLATSSSYIISCSQANTTPWWLHFQTVSRYPFPLSPSLCERSSPTPRPLQSLPKWSRLHPCTTSRCPQTLPNCYLYFSSAQDFLTVSYLMPRRTRVCTVVQGPPPPTDMPP